MTPEERRSKKRQLDHLEKEALKLRMELLSEEGGVVVVKDSTGGRWRLRDVTNAEDARLGIEDYGATMRDTCDILINSSKPKQAIAPTRFHELVHAALQNNWTVSDDTEEAIIRVLEKHLYPVLVQFGLRLDWPVRSGK